MNYGSHPNDTLLAECEKVLLFSSFQRADFVSSLSIDGFFLDVNEADSIYLDDIVFRDIQTAEQQEELWLNQYYGYVV